MTELWLDETFDQPDFDSRLGWFCPPQKWSVNPAASVLVVEPEAKTDYWQKTHYGFEADNGHFLLAELAGDFVLTTQVRFQPAHQYDQAGLMVRISPHCWLKTSVEYEPDGPARLGAVVTNFGYSDWSTQNFSGREVLLRVRREGSDYIIEYAEPADQQNGSPWTQIRIAHLHDDSGGLVQAGLYACSPIDAGYVAEFDFLRLEKGRLK
jgi:regulation of enolase protein 1 (concanavalin A-like superfamily)